MKKLLSLIISFLMLSGLVLCVYADTPTDVHFLFKDDMIYMTADFADYANKTMLTGGNDDARVIWNDVSLPDYESNFATGQQVVIGEKHYTVVIPGDTLKHGKVTLADARMALRIAARIETADKPTFCAADINMDGAVTPADARTILRQVAKLCPPSSLNVDYNMYGYSMIPCEAAPDIIIENGELAKNAVLGDIAETYIVSKNPIASGNYEVIIIVKEELRTKEDYTKSENELKNNGFIFGDISLL